MNYYSQEGQDKWVLDHFGKKKGFFVDIGAADGIELSNTYALENIGWNGICVEANTEHFRRLRENRKCTLVYCAIYSENKYVPFRERGWGSSITEKGRKYIEAITLKKLFELCNAPKVIDYVSLDIEGAEYEALLGFPFDEYKVKLWTIEHNLAKDKGVLKEKIKDIMIKNGYKIAVENVICGDDPFEDWWINDTM
jgi:FkbM family methyltransferase